MSGQQGREVVIVDAVRTPIGRGHKEKGYYKDTHPADLLGKTYTELISRTGIDAGEVEIVLAGCVQQFGEQAFNIARNAWLQEGLPLETSATTLDLQCGSAQQAVNLASALVAAGVHDVVIGSGVEHMGHISFADGMKVQQEYGGAFTPKLMEQYNIVGQGLGAEMIADQWEITRHELDELAVRSHRNAARATDEGLFEREVAPIEAPVLGEDGQPSGETQTVSRDQGLRETTMEALAKLKPVYEGARHTAGSSSQISDGAAAVMWMDEDRAKALGLRPRARLLHQLVTGTDPYYLLDGPVDATHKMLERSGMLMSDFDVFEINEAFASVVLSWAQVHKPDLDRVNVNGGAIALGHPVGSTGSRLITTALHELERTDGELAFVTMCCGGSLGTASILQRI